jgi:hypothetical protein
MSTALLLVLLAVFGLAVGSFLNVVIVRVPAGESLFHPPSKCPLCQAPLAKKDNIPVVSWLLLRGRCRSCQEPIPAGYPIVELANAVLWVVAGLRFGATWPLVPYALLFSVLLALSVIDLELYILPNKITYPSILVSIVAIPLLSFAFFDDPVRAILWSLIRFLTAGESHGRALVVILEGPARGSADHHRADHRRAGPPPARLRPGPAHALRGRTRSPWSAACATAAPSGRPSPSRSPTPSGRTRQVAEEMSPAPATDPTTRSPAPARPRRPRRDAEVRLHRRP